MPAVPQQEREPNSRLYPDVLAKLTAVFGQRLAEVLIRHRKVEAVTGEKNVIGRQNLVEALAHLGILFARAPDLSRDEQLEQVAYLSDHLRRVMMESFEAEVYVVVGSMWDEASPTAVGREYDALAAPLLRAGKLLGHVQPDDVESRFNTIASGIVAARRSKIADEPWDVWVAAADELESAASSIKKLKREMGAAVDAANALLAFDEAQRRVEVLQRQANDLQAELEESQEQAATARGKAAGLRRADRHLTIWVGVISVVAGGLIGAIITVAAG